MFLKKIFLALIVILLIAGHVTYAIPAFARRYNISCTTCHAAFPRLKPYGDDFAGDGFVIPEEERERDYVTAGDDLLWLNKDFPLAMKFEAYMLADDDQDVNNDLQIPWGMKLLSGGSLYKDISYYMYFYLSERGEVAGIEDAYIHFNDIFDTNLDIMAGQFQTSDPLMKRELRLTFEDYQIYKKNIGNSLIDLTYDRGLMFVYGLESTSTDIIGMVVNGNGIGEAEADHMFDQDKYKNFGLRVNQAIDDNVSIGGFIYYGKEEITNNVSSYTNTVQYYGPDIAFSLQDMFDITGQYLYREDSNPFIWATNAVETNGIIGEVIYHPQPDMSRYYITMLYNWIDSEWRPADYHTLSLSGTYLLARNLRLNLEYIRDLKNNGNRIAFGVISGF
ncbi:MAG: hypothetical protein K9M80_04725 [Candidatus Marinimicrobia bacterium]|nr:hypothetical protein [Candidatus Neomarinimicrobiota bacterium]